MAKLFARVSGMTLDQFAQEEHLSIRCGMSDTGFVPKAMLKTRIAPTEKRRGQMSYLGDSGENAGAEGEVWLRGEVHDPTSYRMNGVAGHAGFFPPSTILQFTAR